MKHFLAVAMLILGLNFSGAGSVQAAAMPIHSALAPLSSQSGESAVTSVRGWWAVPLVVGGVILYHHHRHYRHCHRRCWWHRGHRHCGRRCYY
jgi:hypothetical protein